MMRSEANKQERKLRKLLDTYSNLKKPERLFHFKTESPFYLRKPNTTKQTKNLWPGRQFNVDTPQLGRLDRWYKLYFHRPLYPKISLGYCIRGLTLGHPRVSDNQWITTAPILYFNGDCMEAESVEGIYCLGEEQVPLQKNTFPWRET